MNILFCLGSMTRGGAERVISKLANDFISENHTISIVVTPEDNPLYQLDSKIKYYKLGYEKKNIISRTIGRIYKLKQIIKSEDPDIIISFLPEPSFRVLIANFFNHRRIIVSVRNDPKAEYNNLTKKILAKVLYRRANGFVFQTKEAQEWFPKSIRKKSVIIMNPLSKDFIIQKFNNQRNKELVNVGRLVEQKNQKLLIDAFEIVSKKHKDYTLKIYGSGKLEAELKQHIISKNLTGKVILEGEVDNIQQEIKNSAAFILSSDYEGVPNVLLEALAMGIPAVSTDCPCGGPRELMKGYPLNSLVKVGDKEDLVAKIEQIISISDDNIKKIHDFALRIQNTADPNMVKEEWKSYIERVINGK